MKGEEELSKNIFYTAEAVNPAGPLRRWIFCWRKEKKKKKKKKKKFYLIGNRLRLSADNQSDPLQVPSCSTGIALGDIGGGLRKDDAGEGDFPPANITPIRPQRLPADCGGDQAVSRLVAIACGN